VAAGCLTAFAIGRRPRPLDKQQLEEGLRTWEDEGGNLARSGNPRLGRLAANP